VQFGFSEPWRHVVNGVFDFEKLMHTTEVAIKYLDRVVDINFIRFKLPEAPTSVGAQLAWA